jgi:glycosyltransferase involved in cell wall biosynthesis
MSKVILILVNHEIVIYNFRKELVEELIDKDYEVIISCPYGKNIEKLITLGAIHEDIIINRRGINPIKDSVLFYQYRKLVKKYKPDLLLTYTIKPNIYGGLISRITKTPIIVNITGLGTAIEKKGLLKLITTTLYKIALKKADTLFFQNSENQDYMLKKGIIGNRYKLIPGSGVNVEKFNLLEYPPNSALNFIYVGRVMKAKGIDYFLESARLFKIKNPNINFHILGDYEEDYQSVLEDYQRNGYILYHGKVDDVREYYKIAHAIIHPTFHEGMSNVLLEASSSGRPVIASNIPGCLEIIDEGKSGFTFEVKNQISLNNAIDNFINLSYEEMKQMGLNAREKVIAEFDRKKIVNIYIEKIKNIMED